MERFRRRQWHLLYFRSEDDYDETEFFSHDELNQWQDNNGKPWFQGVIYIYYEPSLLKASFSLFSSSRSIGIYKDLITYKKKLNDQRVFLQILQNLPPMYSNMYYREQGQEQPIPPGLIYDEAKELAANKTTTSADWQTSDIIGKYLHEFKRLPRRDNN